MKNEIAVALFITNYISMEKCDRGRGRGRGSGSGGVLAEAAG